MAFAKIDAKYAKACHTQKISAPEIGFFQLTKLNTCEN